MFPIDYSLPADLIAQQPCEPRDRARLLHVDRATQSLASRTFHDLPDLLDPGDLLVLNDTRVVPARLHGKRSRTGGKWEGLFLREMADGAWEMMCQTRGTLAEGEIIHVDSAGDPRSCLELRLLARLAGGRWQAQPLSPGKPIQLLEQFGHLPLPPYIRKGTASEADRTRYQTVYAQQPGAIAAPTAGLHFTDRLFERLETRGIRRTTVTLHVGVGTFQPIQVDDYTRHPMHAEWGQLSQAAVDAINACTGRIVAVGTTSVRVLESAIRLTAAERSTLEKRAEGPPRGCLQPWAGETNIYIYPPFEFKVVNALITNFHLPRTTLLLLVAAFAGVDLTQQAYDLAVAERYRFYSYGDAMLIV